MVKNRQKEGKILGFNQTTTKMFGYTENELRGMDIMSSLVFSEDVPFVAKNIKKELETPYNARGVHKSGDIIELEVRSKNIIYKGKKVRVVVLTDMTQKNRLYREVKENEKRYRDLYENSTVGMITSCLITKKVIAANKVAISTFGYDNFEDVKESCLTIDHYVHVENQNRVYELLSKEGVFHGLKIHLKKKDGSFIWVQASARINNINQTIEGSFVDITEQKKLQLELEESEKKFKTIFNKSPVGIISVSKEGLISSINEYTLRMTGYRNIELLGKNISVLFEKEIVNKLGKCLKAYFEDLSCSKLIKDELEVQIRKKDGTIMPVELTINHICDNQEVRGLVLIKNVSHKKEIEKAKTSLREKETLLKEIHHRVKNNMQVISSLLNLQSNQIDNEELKTLYNQSQERIRAMALIHEKLYQTNDMHHINFDEYIVDLTNYMINSYPINTTIRVNSNLSNLTLNLDQAIPCGLIINEIISNALKYAFEDKESGSLFIKCSSNENEAEIVIEDDGIGISEDILKNNDFSSLGLKLVRALTKQLKGNSELNRSEKGTKFWLKFKIQKD